MVRVLIIAIAALLVAWVLGALFTKLLIPALEKKQFRQFVREEGPESHKKKTGTPSMGGIAIIGSTLLTTCAVTIATGTLNRNIIVIMIMMVLFGLIGFIDDYEKAIKKNNLGLNAKQKVILQLVFSAGFAIYATYCSGSGLGGGTQVWIPFWGNYIDLGWLYIPFVIFVLVAMSNGVNLTDGLDGLASGVTALVSFFCVIAGIGFYYTKEVVFFGALAGACLGFLMLNKNPAKIFMGDTGSMALGGALAAGAMLMKFEFLLAIAGLIYVIEALSVIIQVAVFKKTGKRVFKMAPIHHHFELCGMSERKVVVMFWGLTLIFCLVAIAVMNI